MSVGRARRARRGPRQMAPPAGRLMTPGTMTVVIVKFVTSIVLGTLCYVCVTTLCNNQEEMAKSGRLAWSRLQWSFEIISKKVFSVDFIARI